MRGKHVAIVLMILASCKGPPPASSIASFGSEAKITKWITAVCPAVHSTTLVVDNSFPKGMEHTQIVRCERMFGGAMLDARVEVQGRGDDVCAVRIGPTPAFAAIDPKFVEEWFVDKQLGGRARTLLDPGSGNDNYARMVMLDGIRLIARQHPITRSSLFYLVVDGCGRNSDDAPNESSVN